MPAETPWRKTWSKISHANLRFYGPRFRNPARFLILIMMEDLIYGYGRESAAVSENQLARAAGLTSRTIRNHLPALIKAGHVRRVSEGRRDHAAATYTLAHSAPLPRLVGPSGARVEQFPERPSAENLSAVGDGGTTEKFSADNGGTAESLSGQTTENLSGNRREEHKTESSRSRAAPAAPAARDPVDPRTDPREAFVREYWPIVEPPPLDRCVRVFERVAASLDEIRQACARDGPRLVLEARNPVLWAQKLCDEIVARRARAIPYLATAARCGPPQEAGALPVTPCPLCDGTGFVHEKRDGRDFAKPCACKRAGNRSTRQDSLPTPIEPPGAS